MHGQVNVVDHDVLRDLQLVLFVGEWYDPLEMARLSL